MISAILQDALVGVAEIAYLPGERRFAFIANRFRREVTGHAFERIRCGVRFDEVAAVSRQGFSLRERDRILVLLSVRVEGRALRLDFSGGPGIRLEVGRILCHLDDLGDPWPTRREPRHPVEGESSP